MRKASRSLYLCFHTRICPLLYPPSGGGDCWIQGVSVLPFCGRRDKKVGDRGNPLEERVPVVGQWPFVFSGTSLLRFPPSTDHPKVRKPLLARLAHIRCTGRFGRNTLVNSLDRTRESYGSLKASISSSLASGSSGLRIKGRLNEHPHPAQ